MALKRGQLTQMTWPRGKFVVVGNRRLRLVGGSLFDRPLTESFHEFLIFLLRQTLGQEWLQKQQDSSHVLARWLNAWSLAVEESAPPQHKPGQPFQVPATGDIMSLIMLADDVYRLRLKCLLPRWIVSRLQKVDTYQGARYEIAVAALIVKAGGELRWIKPERGSPSCEFTACLPGGQNVSVEVKSRHRPGAMHWKEEHPAKAVADMDNLYRKALKKDAAGHPLVIFLDINLPIEQGKEPLWWMNEVRRLFRRRPPISGTSPAKEAMLAVTNWAWHYNGSDPSAGSEWIVTQPEWSATPLTEQSFRCLHQACQLSGSVPNDV